jgi:hypothetical protein
LGQMTIREETRNAYRIFEIKLLGKISGMEG